MTWPPAVEPAVYRQLWPDLLGLDDAALCTHFAEFGEAEGRQANRLATRTDFLDLIPFNAATLEIGPFYSPLLAGRPNVRFFDVLSREALIARARALGVDQPRVPVIDFVASDGDLSGVDQSFGYVVSSHCLEHQPDVVRHLRQVERLLRPQGRYFVLVPDKRYCFDAFMAESTIAGMIEAHHSARKTHSLRSVIEHRALTTHNDSARHWAGDHGDASREQAARVASAIREFELAAGAYIDVHAWYFTPKSAAANLRLLLELGLMGLSLERVYPTRRPGNEFWMILQKP